jgi:hypothetical protein
MALAKPGTIQRDGVPLLYSTSITRKGASNDKELFTTALGLVMSDGAATVEYDVKQAVPLAGAEFDAFGYAMSHAELTLQFKFAGYIETVTGRVMEDTVTTGGDTPAEQSFTFKGRFVGRVAA